jgi:gliding motility-associated-like protein
VFWGYTSATGGAVNRHEVCFRYTTFLDRLDDLVLCPNGQVRLQASGGVAYEWNPPDGLSNPNISNPIASPEETTTYVVTVFDDCGFALFDSLQVIVDGDTSFVELGPDITICQGLPLQLSAEQANASYLWSTGSTEPSIEVEFSGLVSVEVIIDEYCFDSDEIQVQLKPQPAVELEAPPTICFGQVLELQASLLDDPDARYRWQDGSEGTVFSTFQAGYYEVEVENFCGSARAGVQLESEFCRGLYLGNVFSPNDDGFNDFFYPQDAGDVASIQYFRIFDRWGGLVFEARDFLPNEPRRGWDGRVGGQPAGSGVYVWVLYGTWRDGLEFQRQGSVHLLR